MGPDADHEDAVEEATYELSKNRIENEEREERDPDDDDDDDDHEHGGERDEEREAIEEDLRMIDGEDDD